MNTNFKSGQKIYAIKSERFNGLVCFSSLDDAMKNQKKDRVLIYELTFDSAKTYAEQKTYIEVPTVVCAEQEPVEHEDEF